MEHVVPALAIGRSVRHAGEFVPARIVIIVEAVGQRRPHHLRHRVGQCAEAILAVGQALARVAIGAAPRGGIAAVAQPGHHRLRQRFQPLPLQGGQPLGPWAGVEHAQRTERHAIVGDQRCAGIEADVRLARHQRHGGKAHIARRVRHHGDAAFHHGERTEGRVARRFRHVDAGVRQEGLSRRLDQADQRDRRVAKSRGKVRDPGERGIVAQRLRVVRGEGFGPARLARRFTDGCHR